MSALSKIQRCADELGVTVVVKSFNNGSYTMDVDGVELTLPSEKVNNIKNLYAELHTIKETEK